MGGAARAPTGTGDTRSTPTKVCAFRAWLNLHCCSPPASSACLFSGVCKIPNCNHPPLFSLCIVEITPEMLHGKPSTSSVQGIHFAGHFKLNQASPHSALGDSNQKIPFSVIICLSHLRIFKVILPLWAQKTPQDVKTSAPSPPL